MQFSRYIASRATRLYLPIWASLVLAASLLYLRPAALATDASSWSTAHFQGVSIGRLIDDPVLLLQDILVLPGTSMLNSSLWSMRFEIAASLILFVLLKISRLRLISVIVSLVLALAFAPTSVSWFFNYLPFFVSGIVLAKSNFNISKTRANLLVVTGSSLLVLPWLLRGMELEFSLDTRLHNVIMLFGTSFLCLGAANPSIFSTFFEAKFAQYLGSRSYSLYLVHAPIVLLVAFWVFSFEGGVKTWPLWVLPTGVLAILVSEIFFRVVESPSHALARLVRARLTSK
jgi:peptidoglycan/LPS O-acetylase OafA/YrhL